MIKGYGMYGFGEKVLSMFDRMIKFGLYFDGIVMVVVFLVCSYVGLVEKGCEIFNLMSNRFGIEL